MLSVLYEDSDILVAVKPAGVESQSARGFAKDMVSEIRRYLTIQARNPQNIHKLTTLSSKGQGKNQPPYVGVIHRLDRPVSGIMVYARNQKAAASLSSLCSREKWKNGIRQWYVENLWIIMVYMWIISDRIRERTGLKLMDKSAAGSKRAELSYTAEASTERCDAGESREYSLVRITSAYMPPPPDPGTIFRPWNSPLWG